MVDLDEALTLTDRVKEELTKANKAQERGDWGAVGDYLEKALDLSVDLTTAIEGLDPTDREGGWTCPKCGKADPVYVLFDMIECGACGYSGG